MAANEQAANEPSKQTIQELQTRYRILDKKKTQAETNLDNAKTALKKLQDEARATYETDDVAELRIMLKKMKDDNEKARREYQASLDVIEAALQGVETKLNAAETPSNNPSAAPTSEESEVTGAGLAAVAHDTRSDR